MPSRARKAISSTVAIALAIAHWPTSAALAACGGTTGGGSGPPSISATEVSTAQALQILRRRQDEAIAAAAAGGSGGNVSVASLSPPPPPPQPAPQAAPPPAPKPVAAKTPPPKPVVAKPAPKVAAKTEAKPEAKVEPKSEAKPAEVKPEAKAPEAKPETTVEAKPEAKAPEVKPEQKVEAKPETKVEAKPEPQPEPKKPDTTYLPKAAGKLEKPAPVAAEPAAPKAPLKRQIVKKPAKAEKTVVAYAAPKKAPAATGYPEPVAYGGSIKDDYAPASAAAPTRGAWAQGYYDYERQGGWTPDRGTPGSLTSKDNTFGMLAGGDVTFRAPYGGSSVIVGVLGGYSDSRTSYNDVTLASDRNDPGKGVDTYQRTNARDTVEGGSVGAYGVFLHNNMTADLLVKADLFNYRQKDSVTVIDSECADNGTFARGTVFDRENTADLTSVVVAGNLANRYMLTRNSWLEPVVGFRYTHLDYSNVQGRTAVARNLPATGPVAFATEAPPLDFGLTDGDMLRLQGGVRYGFAHVLAGDRVWVTTVGGFLYSDVWINGISQDYRDVVEGKLRGMGQFTTALSDSNGMTYLMQLEVRGGDDMIGFGAKGGVRYEW